MYDSIVLLYTEKIANSIYNFVNLLNITVNNNLTQLNLYYVIVKCSNQ